MTRSRPGRIVRTPVVAVLLAAGAGYAVCAWGEEPVSITPRPQMARSVLPKASIRMDVKLVLTPVTVTDSLERPVSGLTRSNFRIFEDDVEQPITSLSQADGPISVGLVFDSSRSMKNRIADSRLAVEQFLRTAAPEDEFLLVTFSDKPALTSPFTRDTQEISRLLSLPQAHGWTALLDAVCLATQRMRHAHNSRKVLLVLSDGDDNNSRYSQAELLSLLREADVRVFGVSLFDRPGTLERMGEETGGRTIWVRSLSELPEAMQLLSDEIRSEYVLGYLSNRSVNDGRYHRVRVEVRMPSGTPLRVSWRHGYRAPDE